jgi:hypothetical protein
MAPEQVERPLSVDHRADIYSLGVVFYEMLTGDLPIGKFSPPSRKVQVDVRLDEIVLRALENDPARRYQHASEVKSQVASVTGTPASEISQPNAQGPSEGARITGWKQSFLGFAVAFCLFVLGFSFLAKGTGGLFMSWLGVSGWQSGVARMIIFGLLLTAGIRHALKALSEAPQMLAPGGTAISPTRTPWWRACAVVLTVLILLAAFCSTFPNRWLLQHVGGMPDRPLPTFVPPTVEEPADLRTAQAHLAELRVNFGDAHPSVQEARARIAALERMGREEPNAPADLREAKAHLAELRVNYGEEHPSVQAMRARIAALSRLDAPPDGPASSPTQAINAVEVSQTVDGLPPVVVSTLPLSGAADVAPGVVELRVRFSKEMRDGSWTWADAWSGSPPEVIGAPHFEADQRTCVLTAKLEPGRTYAFWLNSEEFQNFADQGGRPAVPYLLIFRTQQN